MKTIEVVVARFLVWISYVLTYLLPVNKKRISIISYFNSDLGLEYRALVDELEAKGFQVKYDLHKFNSSLWGKFKYLFSFVHQTYLFNTSKLVILDGNSFVYATIKTKKTTHTMQLWHATGAIKSFGEQTSRRYDIKGYDSLIVSSEYFRDVFSKSLNTNYEKTYALGISKTDYLFNQSYIEKQKQAFEKKYPEISNKKIVLYAPTFRGEGIEDINSDLSKIKSLQTNLGDDYQLVIKLHPLVKNNENFAYDLSKENLYFLLINSDIVISDYSALVYDAALLDKDIILYLYDYHEYIKNRGLCVDINDFIFEKSYNIEELKNSVLNYQKKDYTIFNEKFQTYNNGSSTKRLLVLIENIMKEGLKDVEK